MNEIEAARVSALAAIRSEVADLAISAASKVVELHTMKVDNGVMIMRPVAQIVLPKGKTVELKPGGLHVMLMGLKAPLKGGDKTALTLKMLDSKGSSIPVTIAHQDRVSEKILF